MLILVLAGILATDAKTATSSEAFKVDPLIVPWNPVGHALFAFRLVVPAHPNALARAQPGASPASTDPVQLQNSKTGFTCAMRILEVKPIPDPGILAPVSGSHTDPIVRNSSSPCVE
jgi:hypothetical protein